jgi:hypothetical protein
MGYCVYCGATLLTPSHCHNCGAYAVAGSWHEGPASAVLAGDTGWRPDPTGRHEGRYFASGHATDLIRDGTVEAIDPLGQQQLELGSADASTRPAGPAHRRRRGRIVAVAIVGLLVTAGGAVAAVRYLNRDRVSVDDKYLAAVRQGGLAGEFNSNANAVAHGKQVCRKLEDGGPQQGLKADEIAVEYYCPQFKQGFRVLETATITGSFTLNDESPSYYTPAIEVSGTSCRGAGGYSDIRPGTQVTVKNSRGDVLATAELGEGEGGRYLCTFPFEFEITEGEDRYVVAVGRRGELSYQFGELKARGVSLVLG